MKHDICIIGGAGHAGLPLGVAFALAGLRVMLFDTNRGALEKIAAGIFPFKEQHGERELGRALRSKRLAVSDSAAVIRQSRFAILIIGTPVDEYLNPDFNGIARAIESYFPHFRNGQVLILRSTVYPGTSERIQKYFRDKGKAVRVAFCPERILQGRALEELRNLPQIVSAFDARTVQEVSSLFRKITAKKVIPLQPKEAELSKLFANAWRYIKFAVANQFFMITADHDLDYHRIYRATIEDYPRYQDLAPPGFAAGPCLLKDTMQLAAFNNNNFFLGHAAMLINEGLPNYVMRKLKHSLAERGIRSRRLDRPVISVASNPGMAELLTSAAAGDLRTKTVGILGMAFKADSDDPRDSLSYKLRKVAEAECREVLCTDVHIRDPSFHPLKTVLEKSDIIILATPHREYRDVDPRKYPHKHFIDIWNFWGRSA